MGCMQQQATGTASAAAAGARNVTAAGAEAAAAPTAARGRWLGWSPHQQVRWHPDFVASTLVE